MIKLYWIDVFLKKQCSKSSERIQKKLNHRMFWFYKLAALAGLDSSSDETLLISDVRGVLLEIVGRDHLMISKRPHVGQSQFRIWLIMLAHGGNHTISIVNE